MAVAVYGAVASRSYNDGTYFTEYGFLALDKWQNDAGLAQGRYITDTIPDYPDVGITSHAYDGPFYGTFDFGSAPAELAGKIIDSVPLCSIQSRQSPKSSAYLQRHSGCQA